MNNFVAKTGKSWPFGKNFPDGYRPTVFPPRKISILHAGFLRGRWDWDWETAMAMAMTMSRSVLEFTTAILLNLQKQTGPVNEAGVVP